MNILFIWDIFGKSWRKCVEQNLPKLIKEYKTDLIIANVENIAHGKGTRQKDIDFLKNLGVNIFTWWNHSFDDKDFLNVIKNEPCAIRPANYPENVSWKGYCIYNNVLVINLLWRVFIKEWFDSPFITLDNILKETKNETFKAIIIDFHAETTSEKRALFYYAQDRISALIWTHTHVQTADESIINWSAFITDAGMTGPKDSIIWMEKESVLNKFTTALPSRFEPAEGAGTFCWVFMKIEKMEAKEIQRIYI